MVIQTLHYLRFNISFNHMTTIIKRQGELLNDVV